MKLAIVSLGGKSSTAIATAANNHFTTVDLFSLKDVELHLDNTHLTVSHHHTSLTNYDCIYVRGSYKYQLLQRALTTALHHTIYMPLRPESFSIGRNKFLTLIELQRRGIPIPTTYLATSTTAAKDILANVTYPVIIKIPEGTQGKGVMVADSQAAARSVIDALEVFRQPYIIQEYIETDATDIRAVVIGNKVVAMKRTATLDELRANIHMGATGSPCALDPDIEHIALKSARAVKADICAVDILLGAKPAVIEVNLSPGIDGITKATKQNVAGMIARFLAEQTATFAHEHKQAPLSSIPPPIKKTTKGQHIYTTLEVKNGMIRLPKVITGLSEFTLDDDVIITVSKHAITVIEHKITKED